MRLFFFISFFLCSQLAQSQSGLIDSTFGNNGIASKKDFISVNAMAVQADYKIVCVGDSNARIRIIRYLPEGQLDLSFGSNGVAYLPAVEPFEASISLSVLKNQKILVLESGLKHNSADSPTCTLVQILFNGKLDSSFGKNGIVDTLITGNNKLYQTPSDMCIQSDGKILVTGSSAKYEVITARFLSTGAIDKTFGINGRSVTLLDSTIYYSHILTQPDGKIIVSGTNWPYPFALRYDINGNPDNSFGINGVSKTSLGKDSIFTLHDIALQSNGSIVCAGLLQTDNTKYNIGLISYNTSGILNKSFGKNGIVTLSIENASEANSVIIQNDQITVAGVVGPSLYSDPTDFVLLRLLANGNLDNTFGNNGITITDLNNKEESFPLIAFQNNKIILGGVSGDFGNPFYRDLVLIRYKNDNILPVSLQNFTATSSGNDIFLSWQTVQEINNSHFDIERSKDGHFNQNNSDINLTIATINGKGNSFGIQSYSYFDKEPLQGTNFYRLKQVDKDGKISYSEIVNAVIDDRSVIVIFPNPIKDVLNIKGFNPRENYAVRIINNGGNTVDSKQINNLSSINWDVTSLSKGIYYLSITSSSKTIEFKFIK